MKFYRLSKCSVQDNHLGFEFYTNCREALKARSDWYGDFKDEERVCDCQGSEIDVIEIEPTKKGILAALRLYADHPDNG